MSLNNRELAEWTLVVDTEAGPLTLAAAADLWAAAIIAAFYP